MNGSIAVAWTGGTEQEINVSACWFELRERESDELNSWTGQVFFPVTQLWRWASEGLTEKTCCNHVSAFYSLIHSPIHPTHTYTHVPSPVSLFYPFPFGLGLPVDFCGLFWTFMNILWGESPELLSCANCSHHLTCVELRIKLNWLMWWMLGITEWTLGWWIDYTYD